jgi:hypothetical protein
MGDRNRITFRTGEPVRMTLDTDPAQAKQYDNPRGGAPDYMLIADDNESVAFVPGAAIYALQEAGAKQGHHVELMRMKGGAWSAAILEPEATPPPPPVRQMPPPPQPRTAGANALQPAPTQPPQPLPSMQRPGAAILAGALMAAIDATAQAQQYATSRGLALTMTSEDVRAMALSLYIDARKQEGAR